MRCHYWIFNTRNIRETIDSFARGFIIIFLSGMCLFCWQKCGPRPKLFLRLDIFSTFRGVHTLIFTYVPYIVIGLHEEPANFYREKRSVAFVTGHLITFLMVLSLICLGITQILICENQTIWGLEILLRTIVAALLNTKCNDRFIKNKRYQETSKEYFTIVQMIMKDEGYKYFAAWATFDAWSCPPSPPSAPQTHTRTNKKDTVCLMISAHPTSSPHKFFFQFPSRRMQKFSYHTTAQK